MDNDASLTEGQKAYFKEGDWHDVIMIPNLEDDMVVRYQPMVHYGRIMLHCHRLNHEDRGMMAQENIVDTDGQCECNARAQSSPDPDIVEATDAPTAAPAAETSSPVAAPVALTAAPVVETSSPVAAPTAQTAAPVVETSSPVAAPVGQTNVARTRSPAAASVVFEPTGEGLTPTDSPMMQPEAAPGDPTQLPAASLEQTPSSSCRPLVTPKCGACSAHRHILSWQTFYEGS